MKKCIKFLEIVLVIILLFTGIWYLFGEDGPFSERGQYYYSIFLEKMDSFKEKIGMEVEEPEESEEALVAETEENEEIDTTEDVVLEDTSIVFTGDVLLSDYVLENYDAGGIESVIEPDLLDILNSATVLMINNEFPYSLRGTEAEDKQYTFRVDPKYVSVLTDLGVDIAGIANNHVLDYGKDALSDTFDTIAGANIEYTGAGNSLEEASKLIVETDAYGRTYGFLAASHVIPVYSWNVTDSQPGVFCFYDETDLLEAVEEASKQVDYLYVFLHWGVEHTEELEDYQVTIGHELIDAGCEAVIGMHSHCLQPIEYYNGKPIFYSLGNFIFNSSITSGGACEFIYDEEGNLKVRIIPINATNAYTYKAFSESDTSIFDHLEDISDTVTIDDEGFIAPK